MTLLLNDRIHPKVYKKPISNKNMSNQTLYRTNHITEFINHQKALNNQLVESFEQSSLLIEGSKEEQHSFFETLLTRSENQESLVNHFIAEVKGQQTPIHMIIERLENLERMNEAIMAQLSFQDQSSHAISKTLGDYEVMYQDLIGQQTKQTGLFEEISKKLMVQEAFHQTIMEQLDQQKAQTQKISNKLDSLMDFIMEKFAGIADKIEANYKLTTNFVSGIIGKNDFIKKLSIKRDDKNELFVAKK